MAVGRLYPPLIAARIPAFYQDEEDNLIITVPYEENRAVSPQDYSDKGIQLRVKTVQNDVICFTKSIYDKNENGVLTYMINKSVYQNGELWAVNLGQYYQVQLAYRRKGDLALGYYSSVGITKFSSMPILTIEGMEEEEENSHLYTYKGLYSQATEEYDEETEITTRTYWDVTEKAYNYKFVVKDENNNVVKDTGWLLHNSSTDENDYSSFDSFTYLNELPNGGTVQYFVETNSGIAAQSPEYIIKDSGQAAILPAPEIDTSNCFEEGYILINTNGYQNNSYVIREEIGTGELNKIHYIQSNEEKYLDLTVEQGKEYNYYIYTFDDDNNLIAKSEPAYSDFIDFEDVLISDSNGRQLKLRFNPNISSFKTTVYESKVDTIGSRYPVFNRNGNVKYKEFPIGGLISMYIDENNMFTIKDWEKDMCRDSTASKNIFNKMDKGHLYKRERDFREEVENWMLNGELKLFRSASEGNLVIRILNCNLIPYNNTSRLVYTVSANAVEACGHDYYTLLEKDFYKLGGNY